VVFSLADSAFAFASNSQGRIAMSIENAISYPAAVHPGDTLHALATEASATYRLGFYQVRVTNQADAVVGLFRGTAYRTSEEHPS
jgi:acyl-CoA thioesterase